MLEAEGRPVVTQDTLQSSTNPRQGHGTLLCYARLLAGARSSWQLLSLFLRRKNLNVL